MTTRREHSTASSSADKQVQDMLKDPDGYFKAARERADAAARAYARELGARRGAKPDSTSS